MVYFSRKAQTGVKQTNDVLRQLVVITVETNFLTALVVITDLALFHTVDNQVCPFRSALKESSLYL